jgi:hypothetical protein
VCTTVGLGLIGVCTSETRRLSLSDARFVGPQAESFSRLCPHGFGLAGPAAMPWRLRKNDNGAWASWRVVGWARRSRRRTRGFHCRGCANANVVQTICCRCRRDQWDPPWWQCSQQLLVVGPVETLWRHYSVHVPLLRCYDTCDFPQLPSADAITEAVLDLPARTGRHPGRVRQKLLRMSSRDPIVQKLDPSKVRSIVDRNEIHCLLFAKSRETIGY